MFYLADAPSVTSVTVTTKSAATLSFTVQEFSGVATSNPLDGFTGQAPSTTSLTASSGSLAPTASGDLAVGFVAGHGNAETIGSITPGFASLNQETSTGSIASVVSGYEVDPSTSALSFGGSFKTAMYWSAGIAFFKP